MGILEAIKKGFGAASKNMLLVAVLFVFNLIFNLISIPLTPKPQDTPAGTAPQFTAPMLIYSIIFILASVFMQGGALGAVRDYIKNGSMKLQSFASYGLKYYLRLLGLGALIVLIIAIVAIIATLIVAATAPLNNPVVTVISAVAAILIGMFGLYWIILLVLSPYSIVTDEAGVISAMKKSMGVVKKAFWKTLLLLVLMVLISLGIGFIIGILMGLISVAVPAAGQVIIAVANSIVNSYIGVAMMAAFMVFYLALSEKPQPEKVF